jgi:hypothetical protein
MVKVKSSEHDDAGENANQGENKDHNQERSGNGIKRIRKKLVQIVTVVEQRQNGHQKKVIPKNGKSNGDERTTEDPRG